MSYTDPAIPIIQREISHRSKQIRLLEESLQQGWLTASQGNVTVSVPLENGARHEVRKLIRLLARIQKSDKRYLRYTAPQEEIKTPLGG